MKKLLLLLTAFTFSMMVHAIPPGPARQHADSTGVTVAIGGGRPSESCPTGQVMTGFNADRTVKCQAMLDPGAQNPVAGKTCPTGQVLTGFDANGIALCVAQSSGGNNCGVSVSDALKAYAGVTVPLTNIIWKPASPLAPNYESGNLGLSIGADGKTFTCTATELKADPQDGNSGLVYAPSTTTAIAYNVTTQTFTSNSNPTPSCNQYGLCFVPNGWPPIRPSITQVPSGMEFMCSVGNLTLSFIAGVSDESRAGKITTLKGASGQIYHEQSFSFPALATASGKCGG